MTDEKTVETAKALLAFDDDDSKFIAQGIVTDVQQEFNSYDVSYKNTTFTQSGRPTVTITINVDYNGDISDLAGSRVLVVKK